MGNRDVPDRSTLRRHQVIAYARKTEEPPTDFDEKAQAPTKVGKQPHDVHDKAPAAVQGEKSPVPIDDKALAAAKAEKSPAAGDDKALAATTSEMSTNDFEDNAQAATKIAERPTTKLPAVTADRQRQATVAMTDEPNMGEPPAMPEARVAPAVVRASTQTNYHAVEDPTHMPHPRDLPDGSPSDAARPPGLVPRGDSRSLRRGTTFTLVYRLGTYVITRTGEIGQRGVWRVVDYPTTLAGSSAYARECSRWVDTGFADFRG